ncbi:MAG TPA: hypothetical protein VK106_01700 [Balneolaceae bacterium]|nr:hypothetical protein [Balneolaceae bacterium]
MKSICFSLSLVACLLLGSCSDNDHTYNNPNLLDVTVYFTVNLSLLQFNPLKFPGNAVYVQGYGNGGVIIASTGPDSYVAYDAADPNHPLTDCSRLKIEGLEGVCQCDDHNTYNLFTGTVIPDKSAGGDYEYTLQPYQVIPNGNGTLTVTN